MWVQRDMTLQPRPRGFHLITREVVGELSELAGISTGLLHVHIQHTSASLTLNENASPGVRRDFETWFGAAVPESFSGWTHTLEGSDDMPAHIKASLLGASVTIPVRNGRAHLGTWQGIYLCEHRDDGGRRTLTLTLTLVAGACKCGMVGGVHVERLAGNPLGSSGDDFILVQWTAAVGDQWIAPLHVHHQDDEAWYVLSGTLGFRLGEEEFQADAGSAVLARRGTPHTYRNAGKTEAEYLLVMSPRIAQLIDEIHRPNADVAAAFRAHASEILPDP